MGDQLADIQSELGGASAGLVREIDSKLSELEKTLLRYDLLVQERDRLIAARSVLTGGNETRRASARPPRVSQPIGRGTRISASSATAPTSLSQAQVMDYIRDHPGLTPAAIAKGLGVSPSVVSAHLQRGKGTRFVNRMNGWYLLT
jgi:DNA-binding CsgD family transcriptional regulator